MGQVDLVGPVQGTDSVFKVLILLEDVMDLDRSRSLAHDIW